MFSSAYPDIKLNYSSISPGLSESINQYLVVFNRLHEVLLDVFEKVSGIHNIAANDLFSVVETCHKKISEVTKGTACSSTSSILCFLNEFLKQVEKQAKSLQSLQTSLQDTVIKPLRDGVQEKKEMWKTCFDYADNFAQQICKKETAVQKCYKQYSDARTKVKPGNAMEKQIQIFHDLHNTYLLKLTSANSINDVFHRHVLPHIIHNIELSHCELNDKYRHHISNLLYLQNDMCNTVMKSGEQMHNALENLNIFYDLQYFIKLSNENMKDKVPAMLNFSLPKADQPKAGMHDILQPTFYTSEKTGPNLQRRLASLQQQTNLLVDEISTMRSAETQKMQQNGDSALKKLADFLKICDKEANLNVLLKEMELYTPTVINFLGPIPEKLLSENKHSKRSSEEANVMISINEGTRRHEFVEPRVMIPIACFYCNKLIVLIGKGCLCKVCKVSVHKKCATNVKFCQPLFLHPKTLSAPPESIAGPPKSIDSTMRTTVVSDLIDVESDDHCYDDNEFSDGFSEESDNGGDPIKSIATILDRLLSAPGSSSIRNTNALPDILNFKPALPNVQPIYTTLHQNTLVNGNNISEVATMCPLYDEISAVNIINSEYSHTLPVMLKPPVAKKPVFAKEFIKNGKPPVSMKPNFTKPSVIDFKPSINTMFFDKPPIKSIKEVFDQKQISNVNPLGAIQNVVTQRNVCVCLYDYNQDATHLSFLSGDKVEVLEKVNDEWWHGDCNGYTGYFPSQYVLEINEHDRILRGLYDFSKENDRELNVEEGEILVLISEEGDWLVVRSKHGEGIIPASYVEFL